MTDTPSLIARLRAKDNWTQHKPYWHERNPDGPEAADALEAVQAENATLRDRIGRLERGLVEHNCGTPGCICFECCRAADTLNEPKESGHVA